MRTNACENKEYSGLIDLQDALDRMCDDYELLRTILGLFCLEKLMEKDFIKRLINSANTHELKAWSHQSLGIAKNLSLSGVVEDLENINRLSRNQDFKLVLSTYESMLQKLNSLRELSKSM